MSQQFCTNLTTGTYPIQNRGPTPVPCHVATPKLIIHLEINAFEINDIRSSKRVINRRTIGFDHDRSPSLILVIAVKLVIRVESVVRFPKLSGSGFVAFPVLRGAFREFVVLMDFRPDAGNGLLLFSSDHPNAGGGGRFDFFSVSLVDGKIELRFLLTAFLTQTPNAF